MFSVSGRKAIVLVCLALSAGCGVSADTDELDDVDMEFQALECDRECIRAMVNRLLLLMGEFGNDNAFAAALRELAAVGPDVVPVVMEVYSSWSASAPPDTTQSARPAEMRWRAVHLLGSLGLAAGIDRLDAIARVELPDPRVGEDAFGDEYRIRLRAVAGLEKLGATDKLLAIHALGNLLRTPAAVSLYELGIDVGGLQRVDARRALAEDVADFTDYNPNAGRPAQPEKPGSPIFRVTPRNDTPAAPR